MAERSFLRALADAADGVAQSFREQRNFRIQLLIAVLVVVAAAIVKFDATRWAILALTIGVVLAAELANTAIERAVDCAASGTDERAKAAKHAGAAAVLVASIAAVVVGAWLFAGALLRR